MKKLSLFLLPALLFSCSPYRSYLFTHYQVTAELDPGSGLLSASVQMVVVAGRHHEDSIGFCLNPAFEIHSLAAQDLDHYEYLRPDTGLLVLYLEDPVVPGDQLHIALQYSGSLPGMTSVNGKECIDSLRLDSTLCWYPANRDTEPFTMDAELVLPDAWEPAGPEASGKGRGEWLIRSSEPVRSVQILLVRKMPCGIHK